MGKKVVVEAKLLKKRKLTPKQSKFVKAVSEGQPAYKAAMAAYNAKNLNVANAIAVENLQKPTIQQAVEDEMTRQGITLEAIIRPVAKALSAKRVVQLEGDFYETEVDDIPTQLKGVQFAAQWAGLKNGNADGSTNFNFINIAGSDSGNYKL